MLCVCVEVVGAGLGAGEVRLVDELGFLRRADYVCVRAAAVGGPWVVASFYGGGGLLGGLRGMGGRPRAPRRCDGGSFGEIYSGDGGLGSGGAIKEGILW